MKARTKHNQLMNILYRMSLSRENKREEQK